MRSSRLSIRIDVDVSHGRAALAEGDRLADPLSLAASIEAVRTRLRASLSEAYPDALITVVAQHGRFSARPTRVQRPRRKPLMPVGDAECIHVAEHAEALRAAAVTVVARGMRGAGHAAALDAAAAAADVRLWGQPHGVADGGDALQSAAS